MSYLYYPGCSLKSTGRAYEESVLSVFSTLEAPMRELEDWNCCGATAYMSISELKAFALSARVFSLAEEQSGGEPTADLVVPCAACYLGLNKARRYLAEDKELSSKVNGALQSAGLKYEGRVRVRHPLDVLTKDIGTETISRLASNRFDGIRVACYYGCQLVRPYADFDDQHHPTTMDALMKAVGAEPVDWPLKTRCCGGSLTGTIDEVGLRLSYILLKEAKRRGCDVVATACPLCQFNLECYQSKMNSMFNDSLRVPVVYFTQLLGLALGVPQHRLGLQRLFIPLSKSMEPVPQTGGEHVRS